MLAIAERPIAPPVVKIEEGPFVMTDSADNRLTRLETKFDVIIDQNRNAFGKLDTTHGDHENRLRALERQVWIAFGGATVLGTLGGMFVQYLMSRGV